MKNRYNYVNEYYKNKFGERVLKICVDGGFTCPNRDGTCGLGGCIFCSERGSGDLISKKKISMSNAQKLVSKCLENDLEVKDEISKFLSDNSFDLEKICKEVVSSSEEAINDYRCGKEKALQSVIGKVMSKTRGCADPKETMNLIKSLI